VPGLGRAQGILRERVYPLPQVFTLSAVLRTQKNRRKSRFFYAAKKLMHDFQEKVIQRNKLLNQSLK
jgi:hypothetical protein